MSCAAARAGDHGVEHGERDAVDARRERRVLGGERRIEHRVVVAAHVVQPVAEPPYAARKAAYSSARPRSVRSPLTTTTSGSSASISVDHGAVHHLGVRRLARRRREDRADAPRAGSPRRPHSVSPKCTSLAVATVASSAPDGRASVRTRAGSARVAARRRRPRAGTRCRARGPSSADDVVTGRSVVDLGVADTASATVSPASVVNVTSDLVGPDASYSSASGDERTVRPRGCGGRCGPTAATGPAARPARAGARPRRPHPLVRASSPEPSAAGRPTLGATPRSRRGSPRPPRVASALDRTTDATAASAHQAARSRACAAAAAPASCAASSSERTSTRRVSRGSITSST